MLTTSAKLTIFEGPDGGGKTTAAQKFAADTGAVYVHFGPLPQVKGNLARMYVEAMLPALLGYQDVVFDRCWLSERPYGDAFRGGDNRLGSASIRMLERLTLRCGAVVVRCLPSWEVVESNYRSRRHLELLDNEYQLRQVYEAYQAQRSGLPEIAYDYSLHGSLRVNLDDLRHACHPLTDRTTGNYGGPRYVLVGEGFTERKDQDPWYQWPFGSFSADGCSQWLAEWLHISGVPEADLLWMNADMNLEVLHNLHPKTQIIALGSKAGEELYRLKIAANQVDHPQAWKRFHHSERYPLLDLLKEET